MDLLQGSWLWKNPPQQHTFVICPKDIPQPLWQEFDIIEGDINPLMRMVYVGVEFYF